MPQESLPEDVEAELRALLDKCEAMESIIRDLLRGDVETGKDLSAEFASGEANVAETEEVWCESEAPDLGFATEGFSVESPVSEVADTRAELASRILDHPNIRLAKVHSSGVSDQANARQNIIDTAAGQEARRSSYGKAPGGKVWLRTDMLRGLLALADKYSFDISELCGGSHSSNSRHYLGITVDVNYINGTHVKASHPDQKAFRQLCRDLGATEVLGPGNAHHSTHIHAAWPR
jgi:hypothetical protein